MHYLSNKTIKCNCGYSYNPLFNTALRVQLVYCPLCGKFHSFIKTDHYSFYSGFYFQNAINNIAKNNIKLSF